MRYAIIALIILISGCKSTPLKDGYQFGDATAMLIEKREEYCSETSPAAKAALLLAVRQVVPGWTPVCAIPVISNE